MKRAPNLKTAMGQDTLSRVYLAWKADPTATARVIAEQCGVCVSTVAARLVSIRKSDGSLAHARALTNKAGEIAAARRKVRLASTPEKKKQYEQQLENLIAERKSREEPSATKECQTFADDTAEDAPFQSHGTHDTINSVGEIPTTKWNG